MALSSLICEFSPTADVDDDEMLENAIPSPCLSTRQRVSSIAKCASPCPLAYLLWVPPMTYAREQDLQHQTPRVEGYSAACKTQFLLLIIHFLNAYIQKEISIQTSSKSGYFTSLRYRWVAVAVVAVAWPLAFSSKSRSGSHSRPHLLRNNMYYLAFLVCCTKRGKDRNKQ